MEPLISRSGRVIIRRTSTFSSTAVRVPAYIQLPRFLCPGINHDEANNRTFRFKSTQTRQKPPQSRPQQIKAVAKISSHAADDINFAKTCTDSILKSNDLPSEADVLKALVAIETATLKVTGVEQGESTEKQSYTTPASALLDLDPRVVKSMSGQPVPDAIRDLSKLTYKLLKFENIFITPKILASYVKIQSLLLQPSSFPEMFTLFANKPSPIQPKAWKPIDYKQQNPNAIASAVPLDTANMALETAIAARDMQLALSIAESAIETTAFKRSKLFRNAMLPAGLAAITPVTAYVAAERLSAYQTFIDPDQFSAIAFAGILTYFATVGTIGFVALTTANDQMQRVTWVLGMPLRERWLREDERAAADKIAVGFGFKDKLKWGEEEGADWESLRDWCGIRGMRLDSPSLIEGME